LLKGESYGNCRAVGKWKNELHVFPLSHKRLENSSQKTRDEFSTVPTASTTGLCLKKEKKECDISNELKHVTFLKSFDTPTNQSWTAQRPAS
jgi:hypothetical protein